MIGGNQRRFVESAGLHMAKPIQAAIVQLAEAYDYARDMQCDLWDFAIEIKALRAIGLSLDDLRWMVTSGYVKHGKEITKRSDQVRKFDLTLNSNFTDKTCFVLTDAGLRLTASAPVGSALKRAA
jgi:hypothetical protein